MNTLDGKTVAILATNGFEQSELTVPLETLREAGAEVHVIAPGDANEIRGWDHTDWGKTVPVDRRLDSATPDDYDAVVLPGGQINPDLLRVEDKAVAFVKAVFAAGKPVAAICHGPWLLVEADLLRDRKATSYHSIRTDMKNAGARWVDEPVVVDNGLVTSRKPDDLEAFCAKVIEEIAEGRHQARKVA